MKKSTPKLISAIGTIMISSGEPVFSPIRALTPLYSIIVTPRPAPTSIAAQ